MKRNNSGFTMVELLVTVAVSSIVLAAAASLMLLGLRVHQTTQKETGEQQTVRIVLSALEDLSASGKISRVEPFSDGWRLLGKTADDGKSGAVLLRYKSGKLTSGTSGDQVLLDNLRGAQVILDGSLVTFSFSTAAHSYSTSVFCRTGIEGDSVGKAEAQKKLEELKTPNLPDAADLTEKEKAARFAFLQTLAGQYGSRGEIIGGSGYFSKWYIGGYEGHPGWNQYTPWCACFLSWAADQKKASIDGAPPRFANVDEGMEKFKDGSYGQWRNPNDEKNKPIPGDYVFFDWDGDRDPDHVGAVLCVKDGYLYTIEGNSSGRVALNCYPKNDPRIMGYGVLNWKTK